MSHHPNQSDTLPAWDDSSLPIPTKQLGRISQRHFFDDRHGASTVSFCPTAYCAWLIADACDACARKNCVQILA